MRAPLTDLHIELLADAGIDALELTDEHLALYAKLRLEAELNQVALVDAWESPNSVRSAPLGLEPDTAVAAMRHIGLRDAYGQMHYDHASDTGKLRHPRLQYAPRGGGGAVGAPACKNGHPKAEHQNPRDKSCRACRRDADAARHAAHSMPTA